MRILAITHNFPSEKFPFHGIFAARQFEEMVRQGADVTVLTPQVWCPGVLSRFERWRSYHDPGEYEYNSIAATVVHYVRPPGKWFRVFEHRSLYAGSYRTANRLHQTAPFDIVYARFLFPEGYAAVRLAKKWGVPAVGVGAGDEVNVYPRESPRFRSNLIRTIRGFKHLCASGDEVARKIHSMVGVMPTVVQGVVDTAAFKPVAQDEKTRLRGQLGLPVDKHIVLYLGTFKRAKGVYELIEAFADIRRHMADARLVFCGYGREEEQMRAMVAGQGVKDSVHFGGIIPPDEVHKWMQAADVFVLPSYSEGMPNALMEAMACGLPVVATRVGGIPTAVGDCSGAIIVDTKAIGQLGAAVKTVLASPEKRLAMSLAVREQALRDFSVQQNAATVLSCLEDAVRLYGKNSK